MSTVHHHHLPDRRDTGRGHLGRNTGDEREGGAASETEGEDTADCEGESAGGRKYKCNQSTFNPGVHDR